MRKAKNGLFDYLGLKSELIVSQEEGQDQTTATTGFFLQQFPTDCH